MKKRFSRINLKILAVGHFIYHSINYSIDYVLYPLVVYGLGPFKGGAVMIIVSIAINLFVLYGYNFLEKDLLGIESAKEFMENFFKEEEEEARKSWFKKKGKKIFHLIFHKNKIGQFVFLSIQFDPIVTTIYMKPGYHMYNGLSFRDWKIFLGSTMVSNIWWTGLAFTAIATFKGLLDKVI